MRTIARIHAVVKHSSVDGAGIRYVVFFQGCPHCCEGCHNPQTHDPDSGQAVDVEDIIAHIRQTKYLDGITLSGGEPFAQPQAVKELAEAAHRMGMSVWAYSGWTYEQLLSGAAGSEAAMALREVDILVDGPFIQSLRSAECLWRGSMNQRVIDVSESIIRKKPFVLYY